MRQAGTLFAFLLIFAYTAHSQSTAMRVYQILQEKCVQCHNNADPEAGLDLQGSGANEALRALQVYNNLVNVTPTNAAAAAKGDAYIYPGRADRSFLFRKINQGLEPLLGLDAAENQPMPPYGQPSLTAVEKELLRQWILFGAPPEGEVVSEAILEGYYSGNAIQSFPDGAPEAPDEASGFQIKMGPFYLAPTDEVEYFQKYELDLPEDVEVTRLDIQIGTYSHHMIVYDFDNGGSSNIPPGLRLDANHANIGLVAAVQEPTDLRLPQGSAFIWDNQLVLDLNAHYINYSATLNYQAEVYVNVYTQPAGTAAQEMHTDLISNFNIYIPNNGDLITHEQHVNYNAGDVYLWGVMGHTHQYGTGYKVYERLPGGVRGELIYDASCAMGIPGCVSPFFDYQHIPMRYFEPLHPLSITPAYGFIHEASWINDGPVPVNFGPTSDDEMMVMIVMYTRGLEGIVDTEEAPTQASDYQVYPNPSSGQLIIEYPFTSTPMQIHLMDASGQPVFTANCTGTRTPLDLSALPGGLYFYKLTDASGAGKSGKIILR
jgi:hypothetical protein